MHAELQVTEPAPVLMAYVPNEIQAAIVEEFIRLRIMDRDVIERSYA